MIARNAPANAPISAFFVLLGLDFLSGTLAGETTLTDLMSMTSWIRETAASRTLFAMSAAV